MRATCARQSESEPIGSWLLSHRRHSVAAQQRRLRDTVPQVTQPSTESGRAQFAAGSVQFSLAVRAVDFTQLDRSSQRLRASAQSMVTSLNAVHIMAG